MDFETRLMPEPKPGIFSNLSKIHESSLGAARAAGQAQPWSGATASHRCETGKKISTKELAPKSGSWNRIPAVGRPDVSSWDPLPTSLASRRPTLLLKARNFMQKKQ